MVKFRSKNDLKRLYEIQDDGQELKGIIYSHDEDESEDLVLVFEKHTLTITEEGVARVEKRYNNVTEAIEARNQENSALMHDVSARNEDRQSTKSNDTRLKTGGEHD